MNEPRIYGPSPAALAACTIFALLGCRQDPGDAGGDDADAPPQDRPMADEDSSGDGGGGDGDGDPGEAEPICDLSQFPRLHPEWIVEGESPIEGEVATVVSLEVTADALFASGSNNLSGSETGFLERRSLSGDLEWSQTYDYIPHSLEWDGEYLYGAGEGKVRRWTADGADDAWIFDARARSLADIAVGELSIAIVGSFDEPDGYEDDWADAYYAALSKTAPPLLYESDTHAVVATDDFGSSVVQSPWGGWIAAGVVRRPNQIWLRGFGGSTFHAELRPYEHPHVTTMIPHDDELLVVGWSNFAPSGVWMTAVSSSGEQLWQRPLWICEGMGASLLDIVELDGSLWGLGSVRSAPKTYSPLLVRMSFSGAVEQVYAIQTREAYTRIGALASFGTHLYFGGHEHDGTSGHPVIARVSS